MLQAPRSVHARPLGREVKFLLPAGVAAEVIAWTRQAMLPDPHGGGPERDEYTVSSLYLDSPTLDVYHRRGSYARGKYRVRRYGTGNQVFLERKLRTTKVLVKRRTIVDIGTLGQLNGAENALAAPEAWFMRRVHARGLVPTCQITYCRIARLAFTTSGPVRLTCDRALRARAADALEFASGAGLPVQPDWQILEMKFQREFPAIFRRLVGEFVLEPRSVSKYRLSLEALDRTGVTRPLCDVETHA